MPDATSNAQPEKQPTEQPETVEKQEASPPSFGQRLSATLAQPRQQFRVGGWLYGLIGVLLILALLLPPISLPKRLGITGYTTLNAANSSLSHPDGLTLSVHPETFTGRLR
ncbi:MAG: hypothetical protein JSV36_04645, partial [Anaerolineae bacterium]